jgi:hypothetical protein
MYVLNLDAPVGNGVATAVDEVVELVVDEKLETGAADPV